MNRTDPSDREAKRWNFWRTQKCDLTLRKRSIPVVVSDVKRRGECLEFCWGWEEKRYFERKKKKWNLKWWRKKQGEEMIDDMIALK